MAEENTIEITISPFSGETHFNSHHSICDIPQSQSPRKSIWHCLDRVILTLVYFLRQGWSILPMIIRGPATESEVLSNLMIRMKLDPESFPEFSHGEFEQTLERSQVGLVLAYRCDLQTKRDLKRMLNNPKVAEISKAYPLCPINSYSAYYNQYIKQNVPQTYSVYLMLFATGKNCQVMLLGVYKPNQKQIILKVSETLREFRLRENNRPAEGQMDKASQSNTTSSAHREECFRIPKVLMLEDLGMQMPQLDQPRLQQESQKQFESGE